MSELVADEGTVATLGGRRVAIGNIWPARDDGGPTAVLHFEDDSIVEAREGTVLELGAERWRVAAVREGRPFGEVAFAPA